MFSITSSTIMGIEAIPVQIETDISNGMNNFTIVGLPDASVKEARDRIRAALKNCGFGFPRGRITINLAPAHLRKQGSVYDLPIALSILVARGEIPPHTLEESVVLGELALDGSLRRVRGVLTTALMTHKLQKRIMIIPKGNEQEAAVIPEIDVYGFTNLKTLVDYLRGDLSIQKTQFILAHQTSVSTNCFSFIKGQELAKRGLEIAASGGHNILLSGPPGTGKTLLAKSFPSILPPLSREESIEVTSIASVTGELGEDVGLIAQRPFRAPHHSSSAVSLVGGGSFPLPGEISLAHRGVLFLDELPEFSRHVLEHLRGPLEDGFVTISRAQATVKFPSRFILIAAMNPCPCGYATDPKHRCVCTRYQIEQYQKRVSGPLLDRFDLRIEVSNLAKERLLSNDISESSDDVRMRVMRARKKQADRFLNTACHVNAEISASHLDSLCPLTPHAKDLLSTAIDSHALSPRAATRIRKIARTIADLNNEDLLQEEHVAEALQFRGQQLLTP